MAAITTSIGFRTLKSTLDAVNTDKTDGIEDGLQCYQYCDRQTMADNYVDDLEAGGPGFATEKDEGEALDVMDVREGYMTRYFARKFGLILEMTEELDEDGKYNDKYLQLARRNKRAVFKALELDCANMLNRAADSGYVGGDGLSLANSLHTIPTGGTFSNTLATPFSPSMAALNIVRQNCMKLPSHDGIREGYEVVKIVHPIEQDGAWEQILGTKNGLNTSGQDLNIVANKGYKHVAVTLWTASETNWGVTTNAEGGLCIKWRRKPKSRTWYDEPTEIIKHGISARWGRGWSNPRGFYFSAA